jgi:hypothetical protein
MCNENQICEKPPLSTRLCAHPRCNEVIYRDTLDKDTGFILPELNDTTYFCSKLCALEVLGNKIYFNMAAKRVRY